MVIMVVAVNDFLFWMILLRIYHVRVPACGARFAGGPARGSTDSTTFFQGLLTVDRQYLDAVFLCGP